MDNDSFPMPALSSDVPESQRHVPLDKHAPPQQPQLYTENNIGLILLWMLRYRLMKCGQQAAKAVVLLLKVLLIEHWNHNRTLPPVIKAFGYGASRDDLSTMRAWLPMPGKNPPEVTGRELVEWATCRWRVVPNQRSLKAKKRSLLAHPRVYLQFSKVPGTNRVVIVCNTDAGDPVDYELAVPEFQAASGTSGFVEMWVWQQALGDRYLSWLAQLCSGMKEPRCSVQLHYLQYLRNPEHERRPPPGPKFEPGMLPWELPGFIPTITRPPYTGLPPLLSHSCDTPGCVTNGHQEVYWEPVENDERGRCDGVVIVVELPGLIKAVQPCSHAHTASKASGKLWNSCRKIRVVLEHVDEETAARRSPAVQRVARLVELEIERERERQMSRSRLPTFHELLNTL